MVLGLSLSCSKLLAAYEFRTVIRLDRDYLINVEGLYRLASNQNRVFSQTMV